MFIKMIFSDDSEKIVECDSVDRYDTEDGLALEIHTRDGRIVRDTVDIDQTIVYLMNDEGKTIDKIKRK